MTIAFVFPGQGSQAVGMGRELVDAFPEARAVFEEVDDALGERLSQVVFEGPEDSLKLTANTQPALLAMSIATVRCAASRGVNVSQAAFAAGHSLGEYSAMCAAGTLSLSDAARLVRIRGNAMQQAVPAGEGAMAALIGADLDVARSIAADAAQGAVCEVANDNAPGQIVLSGAASAIDRAIAMARERGIRKAARLPVSAPFHCTLMAPAAAAMSEALADVDFVAPSLPIVTNVTAEPTRDPAALKAGLVEQVTGRVRWTESVHGLARHGVTHLVEMGAGKVLTGLARRIDKSLGATAVGSPADLDILADVMGQT